MANVKRFYHHLYWNFISEYSLSTSYLYFAYFMTICDIVEDVVVVGQWLGYWVDRPGFNSCPREMLDFHIASLHTGV